MEKAYSILPMLPAEEPIVVKQWLNSYMKSPWAGVIPQDMYYEVMGRSVGGLFARGTQVAVARDAGATGLLLGWAAYERTPSDVVLHYLYVKPHFRGQGFGIARELLTHINPQGLTLAYTFRTHDARKLRNAKYLPGIARRKAPPHGFVAKGTASEVPAE